MKVFAAFAALLMVAAGAAQANSGRIHCELELGALVNSLEAQASAVDRDNLQVAASLCRVDTDRALTTMNEVRRQAGLSRGDTQVATVRVAPEWADVH